MNDDNNSLRSVDKGRSHELRTLGGLISPVWGVAEEVLESVIGEDMPEEFDRLRRISTDAKALLDKVVEKSFEEDLEEHDAHNFKDFYHQSFVAWQRFLHELVPLIDDIMESASHSLTDIEKIREFNEKLRGLLNAEEREVF